MADPLAKFRISTEEFLMNLVSQGLIEPSTPNNTFFVNIGDVPHSLPPWILNLDCFDFVLSILRSKGLDNLQILNFLINPRTELRSKTPIECLKNGEINRVLMSVNDYGEHGAL